MSKEKKKKMEQKPLRGTAAAQQKLGKRCWPFLCQALFLEVHRSGMPLSRTKH